MMYTGMSNVKSQILSIYRGKSWNFNFRETVFIIEFEEIICFTVGGSTEGSGGWYSNQRSNYCGGRSVQEKSRIGRYTLLVLMVILPGGGYWFYLRFCMMTKTKI